MAAYISHLRKIHANEVLYNGKKPTPKPFTTDKDILDRHHKFLRSPTDIVDPLVQAYEESLIKDCVLVDLSRYKEKQVALSGVWADVGCYEVEDY
jgi:Folate-sensitive fragile site protein Fra10Ac1